MPNRRDVLRGSLAAGAGLGLAGRAAALPIPTANAQAVQRRRIPRTGELVPCVGLGTSRTLDVDPDGDLGGLVEVMRIFLAAGGAVVDSSPMYGHAETVVGRLLDALGRHDVFFATKVWTDEGREAGIEQMTASARRMGAQRIDLMQIHNLVDYATHLATLREWKAEGRVRYVGATEMRDLAEVERIVREDELDFIQVPYSMVERQVEERVLPAARDHGVGVLVMRPFQRAGLFDKVEGEPLPEWASEIDCTSWAQFFLKWVLGHPAVTCPIPATSDPKHVVDNMGAGVGRMPDDAMRKRMLAHLESL
jgi:aryl-alcohol dehydrogenase-like predicted oxidoreductase